MKSFHSCLSITLALYQLRFKERSILYIKLKNTPWKNSLYLGFDQPAKGISLFIMLWMIVEFSIRQLIFQIRLLASFLFALYVKLAINLEALNFKN